MKDYLTKKIKLFWKGWGCSILIAVIIATSFKSAIADWNVVPTGSMKPTIVEGDRVFINKLAYDLKVPYTTWHISKWDDPKRGDIVVFYSPYDGKRLIKRVIGVPGDVITMRDNHLIINGEKMGYAPVRDSMEKSRSSEKNADQVFLNENLSGVRHPLLILPHRPSIRSFGPVNVPEGNYFMMGDNRDNSADSRYFGFVGRDQIVGRATTVVASFDLNNKYWPRWQRFFTELP